MKSPQLISLPWLLSNPLIVYSLCVGTLPYIPKKKIMSEIINMPLTPSLGISCRICAGKLKSSVSEHREVEEPGISLDSNQRHDQLPS